MNQLEEFAGVLRDHCEVITKRINESKTVLEKRLIQREALTEFIEISNRLIPVIKQGIRRGSFSFDMLKAYNDNIASYKKAQASNNRRIKKLQSDRPTLRLVK